MTSKNSLTTTHETPFDKPSQKDIGSISNETKDTQMTLKTLVASILLSSSLFLASEVQARPNMTDEQLAEARETAQQMKPPVDFDALLDEADRLGVICEGDLTRRIKIATCEAKIEIAQSQERQAKLDEENAKLEESIKTTREELRNEVNALADKADEELRRLNQ